MPAVVRLSDSCTGHACFPTRPNTQASSNVFVNGRGVHRVGDSHAIHSCGKSFHASTQASGSSTVYVNGKAMARVGDSISCGSSNASGSYNVFAN